MNETNTGQKPKTSKLAIASLLSVLLPHFLFILSLCFIIPSSLYSSNSLEVYFMIPLSVALFGGLVASPILGILALRRIKRSNGLLVGKGQAITAIVVSGIVILISVIIPIMNKSKSLTGRKICRYNIKGLGTAIQSYADQSDGYLPTAENWCDLLKTKADIPPEGLVCGDSNAVYGKSTYALNKNIAYLNLNEIEHNIVFLFETAPGWNQVGGPDILTTEHHARHGCHVLFADGTVRFVKTKDLDTLRWEP